MWIALKKCQPPSWIDWETKNWYQDNCPHSKKGNWRLPITGMKVRSFYKNRVTPTSTRFPSNQSTWIDDWWPNSLMLPSIQDSTRALTPNSLNLSGGGQMVTRWAPGALFKSIRRTKQNKHENQQKKQTMLTQRRGQPGAEHYQHQQIHSNCLLETDIHEHWIKK